MLRGPARLVTEENLIKIYITYLGNSLFFGQTLWMEVVCSRCDEFSRNVQ